jgi:hypothetical protein
MSRLTQRKRVALVAGLLAAVPAAALTVSTLRRAPAAAEDHDPAPPAAVPSPAALEATADRGEPDWSFRFDAIDLVTLDLVGVPPELPQHLHVRVVPGTPTRLLPVYVPRHLSLPSSPGDEKATVDVIEALYHPQLAPALRAALDAKYGKGWKAAEPVGNQATVSLWLDDNGEKVTLGEALFNRYADQKERSVTFALNSGAAERAKAAGPRNLGLRFSENYRGKYKFLDLEATASSLAQAGHSLQNLLESDPQGRKARLVVGVGGGINQKRSLQQYVGRQVSLDIVGRQGRELNPRLLDGLLDKLFAAQQQEIKLGHENDQTVVTFVFQDGLKATATLGTFKGMRDYAKKEAHDKSDQSQRGKTHVRNSGGVKGEANVVPILTQVKTDITWNNENDRDWAKTDKVEAYRLAEILKTIDADIPVAALDAKQLQTVASRTESEFKVGLGTFQDGQKTVVHDLSMQSLLASAAPKKVKTQKEVDEEALAAVAKEVKLAQEQLDQACKGRDAIRADNKVHEDRLTALKAELSGATASFQAADANYSAASAEYDKACANTPIIGQTPEGRDYFARHFKLTELGDIAGARHAHMDFLDKEVKARDADLQPARAKLAEAEKKCAALDADLKKRVAKMEALEVRIRHQP